MSSPIYKAGSFQKAIGDREAIFVASSSAPDRVGDVVEQNWYLQDFLRNPVLLFQHQDEKLPIGRVKEIWTEGAQTFAHAEATPKNLDEMADKVWSFIKHGFLNAVSAGFLPLDRPVPRKDGEGRFLGYRYPRNSLLELSVVSVPAHQDAVAVARSMDMSSEDMSRFFDPPRRVSRVEEARRFTEIQRLRVS